MSSSIIFRHNTKKKCATVCQGIEDQLEDAAFSYFLRRHCVIILQLQIHRWWKEQKYEDFSVQFLTRAEAEEEIYDSHQCCAKHYMAKTFGGREKKTKT